MSAVYLYGFARPAGLTAFTAPGVEPGRDAAAWPFGDVAAVVGEVTPGLIAPASDPPTAEEQARIVGQALRHQEVIEAVSARSPVLPVRYGAVFSSREALAALVAAHRPRIAAFLDRVDGRVEWAVKGHLASQEATAALLARDPELAARQATLPAAPGARYFQERKLHTEAERRVAGWLATAAAEVRGELGAVADAACELRRTAPPEGGRKLVYHEAFLVPRDRLPAWLDRLDALNARFADTGLSLTGTGPWPPASFAPPLEGSPA